MTLDSVLFQALNGLAGASGLFLVGAGLSLIFGVTRIINMAHGSLYMVGIYLAYTIATAVGGGLGFWGGIVAAALGVAALGAVIEMALLRRIYHVPELFQLLATFALVLVINDATLWLWGPEDLLGPRAPGLRGAVDIFGRRFPSYDLMLIATGPAVLVILHLVLARTRFGRLVRAATQDRAMVGALGVNQALLFTAVFTAGSFLAGLGGALQLAREPANLAMDLTVLGDAFVVVVVGGMGSIPGAYLAAVLIAEIKALCISIGTVHFGGFDVNFHQADAGGRIRGDGGGADRAPARAPRRHPRCAALRRHDGSAAAPGLSPSQSRRRRTAHRPRGPRRLRHGLALHAGARHRRADRRHLRHQPAFHHGPRRHAFVRACRLFRARHLWGGAAGEIPESTDAARARGRTGRRDARRAAVRLVRGAARRHLSRHAYARLRPDRVVHRVPVAGGDRRLQRRGRHLADARRSTRRGAITSCASRWRRSSS